MIRWPHGETNVTSYCQNRCIGCNHLIPIANSYAHIDPETMRRDLAIMTKIVHFDRYNLVGGEPTLHPEIVRCLQIVRESGITDYVTITTNGQNFARLPDALYQNVNELIVTPYKLTADEVKYITDKCTQFGVTLSWHPVIFTQVAHKQRHSSEQARELYKNCWYNINRHVIDNGYFYRCCTAPFIPELLLGLEKTADALQITDTLTEAELLAYQDSQQTPASCFVCASNMGARHRWGEEADPKLWVEKSIF